MVTHGASAGGHPPGQRIPVLGGVLVLVEALTVLAAAGWEALATVLRGPDDPVTAWAAVALGLLVGAGLLAVTWGLVRRRRWARSPALVTQILALPVGLSLLQSDRPAVGGSLLAVALAGFVVLISPAMGRGLDGSGGTGA